MPVLDPIIADLIERARSRPAPHTALADGRIFFAWPDGRLVRWEITEGGAVIDSGRAYLPVGGGGWTANSATGLQV